MRLYTRTGDRGEASLLGGIRLAKDDQRFDVIGTLDELNAQLGAARALLPDDQRTMNDVEDSLESIQRDLFVIGAYLAEPEPSTVTSIAGERILELERQIDAWDAEAGQLIAFILPGGTPAACALHIARAVCRRAERALVTLTTNVPVAPTVCTYVNRLSDLLFAAARVANARAGVAETTWTGKD